LIARVDVSYRPNTDIHVIVAVPSTDWLAERCIVSAVSTRAEGELDVNGMEFLIPISFFAAVA